MKIKGIAASKGIAVAKLFVIDLPQLRILRYTSDPDTETARFDQALSAVISDLEMLRDSVSGRVSQDGIDILEAHRMMAEDPDFTSSVREMIRSGRCNAEYAANTVGRHIADSFEALDNEYIKTRAEDIRSIVYRINCKLLGIQMPDLSLIREPVIIAARDLTAADLLAVNREYVCGFVTVTGSWTSHIAIMARSMQIPTVVGAEKLMKNVRHGETAILDGSEGCLITDASEAVIREYEIKREQFIHSQNSLYELKDAPTVTVDGREVEIYANVLPQFETDSFPQTGAQGIGLYRTEFLYLERDSFPDEETQFQAYKKVLEGCRGSRVIIRTLDIGGDNLPKYIKQDKESNPFLGLRAIRYSLHEPEIFRLQLRALLRASVYGKLAILFPMITTVDELRKAKAYLEEEKRILTEEGTAVADDIEVGVMIEVPAAAVSAYALAAEADFFSIGTNDLIQYAFAADRMSEKVSYLYQPLHPAVLALVKMAIDGAHAQGKWCGMSGEMAGDEDAIPLLLGLGLDEFSMSEGLLLSSRKLINSLSYEETRKLAEEALRKATQEEVEKLVRDFMAENRV